MSFIIMGVFGTVDGVFAARGISQAALGAINFVWPFFSFSMAIGSMLSIGGTALIAKKKGSKLHQEARENFTLLTVVTFAASGIISIGGWFFRRPILRLLGTDADVFYLALEYIQPLIFMMPFVLVGIFLVQMMIAEGRPALSMFAALSGSIVSTSLNALFIFVLDMGVFGLALASGLGYAVPMVFGIIYFTFTRKKGIYFVPFKWDAKVLGRSSINGISEMIGLLAMTVTTTVMNNVLVRIIGWEGVAAAGIALAAQGIFTSLFFGYATGIAPVVSYNYGRVLRFGADSETGIKRRGYLKKIFRISLVMVAILSVIALAGTQLFADLLVRIYISPADPFMGHLHGIAVRGLRIITFGFVFMGFNFFATAWFTAYNDGMVSGIMSLLRTMVFSLTLLLTLPRIWEPALDGAWFALPIAEVLAIFMTVFLLIKMGRKYFYLGTV